MDRWTSPWFCLSVAACVVAFVFVLTRRCPTCGGRGIDLPMQVALERLPVLVPCETCGGEGALNLWTSTEPRNLFLAEEAATAQAASQVELLDLNAKIEWERSSAVVLIDCVLHNRGGQEASRAFEYVFVDSSRFVQSFQSRTSDRFSSSRLKPGQKERVQARASLAEDQGRSARDWRVEVFDGDELVASCPVVLEASSFGREPSLVTKYLSTLEEPSTEPANPFAEFLSEEAESESPVPEPNAR